MIGTEVGGGSLDHSSIFVHMLDIFNNKKLKKKKKNVGKKIKALVSFTDFFLSLPTGAVREMEVAALPQSFRASVLMQPKV